MFLGDGKKLENPEETQMDTHVKKKYTNQITAKFNVKTTNNDASI